MSGKTRTHIFVSGRVQGVYFRDSMQAKAVGKGVTGWVQNLPDGRVEAVLEGDETDVQELVNWAHHGPPGAIVATVEVVQEDHKGEYADFIVRRLRF